MKRASGVLLHVTSLPGPHGIGDLGKCALRWVDFLAAAKQKYWQILPLGPTGYGNSPYASYSASAGNFLLISLEELVDEGMLLPAEFEPADPPRSRVNFERAKRYKHIHLLKAYARFRETSDWRRGYDEFVAASPWLAAYATFACKKESCDEDFIRFQQFIFHRQVLKLKAYANSKGISLIGDLPMYVAEDSADRFEFPELFDLTSGFVAGAPPCETHVIGQKWGNPLFRWEKHRETQYAWWVNRIRAQLQQVDMIRLDYFCGYEEFWATNGRAGHWRRGPGADLFEQTRRQLDRLPFIAEDLGELTLEINALRDRFGIMSTKIMQYAFDGLEGNPYLPENFRSSNCVVYTGTHDNDTARGWYEQAPDWMKENVRRASGGDGRDISWDLIKLAAKCRADLLIVPYQDVLCLGREARFNTPGTVTANNWSWMLTPEQINDKAAGALAWLVGWSGRN